MIGGKQKREEADRMHGIPESGIVEGGPEDHVIE